MNKDGKRLRTTVSTTDMLISLLILLTMLDTVRKGLKTTYENSIYMIPLWKIYLVSRINYFFSHSWHKNLHCHKPCDSKKCNVQSETQGKLLTWHPFFYSISNGPSSQVPTAASFSCHSETCVEKGRYYQSCHWQWFHRSSCQTVSLCFDSPSSFW